MVEKEGGGGGEIAESWEETEAGGEKGREGGGGRFSPNVLKHTDARTPRCLSRLLPWENPSATSEGGTSG